jgi:hypothetical protein
MAFMPSPLDYARMPQALKTFFSTLVGEIDACKIFYKPPELQECD